MTIRATRELRRAAPLLLWAFGSVTSAAFGGVNVWTTSGPLAARVSSVATDPLIPGLVYASVVDRFGRVGTFRTTTSGSSWSRLGLVAPISALATGPTRTVFAGGDNNADFKSVDAGATWQEIRPAHTAAQVAFIKVDPADVTKVYLQTRDTVVPGTASPVGVFFRSSDAGLTWQVVKVDADIGVVWNLAFDVNNRVLHAVKDSGYFKSSDFGTTWSRIENGLHAVDARVRALLIDPVMPSTVYAAGRFGLYKSSDSGNSFSRIGTGLPSSPIDVLVIVPTQPSRLFAGTRGSGVYATADGGQTWTALNTGLGDLEITALALDASGTSLHAGTAAGVFDYQFASETLVLNVSHPFRIELVARDPRTGATGAGLSKYLSDLAGYFSLPTLTLSPETPEVFVKIVDGRAVNGRFWVFHGGLTDLEYTLTVPEESSGRTKTYFKAAGSPCGEFDTAAFGP